MLLQSRNTRFRICAGVGCLLALAASVILALSWKVELSAAPRLYESLDQIPVRGVGLVLGTSRNRGAGMNEFYAGRIRAAAQLFLAGKVRHIITSGTHPSKYYNEPVAMKRDLVAAGVPADRITEDGGGLRTLDSVVRAHSVMGLESFTIISQRFHAARAVYIGTSRGLDVVAYCAPGISAEFEDVTPWREYGARVKAVWDVMLGTEPVLLDQPVPASSGWAENRQTD